MDGEDKTKGDENSRARKWLGEISAALDREKSYRTEGQKCVEIFEGDKPDDTPFAILYSNTETMLPALYNARPIPVVKRRFDDPDPVGRLASEIVVRTLKYEMDAVDENHDSFDDFIIPAVVQALVVNRGLTKFKYDAQITKVGDAERVASEGVFGEEVQWDDFVHGYARTWKKVPWAGFRHVLNEEEVKENFPEKAAKFRFTEPDKDTGKRDSVVKTVSQAVRGKTPVAVVWEIWCKKTKKVYFVSEYCEGFCKPPVDDPLGLTSFFPCPRPINLFRKISTLVPTPLYVQYKSQAVELNKITVRLKRLIEAAKIRGFYNATVEGIDKALNASDTELVPVENMQSMPDGTGVDKLIYLFPLGEIVAAIQALYQQREQCKQVIYEITGVSDILRGASVASETATAQNLKNQWGSLRLKKMQKEIQRYCRECLAIMAEISVNKLSLETLRAMTSIKAPTEQEKQGLVGQYQQLMAQGQQMGQQPPPNMPDPQALPTWEDALGLLKNELLRGYRIDIETNSTVDAEASQDKQDISELLNALSQFLNGVAPLVENGTLPFQVAQQMMLAISRRFNFGSKIVEYLEKMQPPPQKGPDPADQAKMEMAKAEHEFLMKEKQLDLRARQAEMQLKEREMQLTMEMMEREHQLKIQDMELKAQDMARKAAFSERQHQMKMQTAVVEANKPKPEPVGK